MNEMHCVDRAHESGGRAKVNVAPILLVPLAIAVSCGWVESADAFTISTNIRCTSPGLNSSVAGRVFKERVTREPRDGNGSFSTVAGCDSDGGFKTGVAVYGAYAAAGGDGASVFGFNSAAERWASAVGVDVWAKGVGSTAMGFGSQAAGRGAVSIGSAAGDGTTPLTAADSTTANGAGSIAIGANSVRGARAFNDDAIALGGQATAQSTAAIAVGRDAAASGPSAVAVGPATVASAEWSSAVGDVAKATAKGASAFGRAAQAAGESSLALGQDANAGAARSTALGTAASAQGIGSAAVGFGSSAAGLGAVSIGSSAGDGKAALSAANSTKAEGAGSIAIGANAKRGAWALKDDSIALGGQATSDGRNAIAIGMGAKATGYDSIAIGPVSVTSGSWSIALGSAAKAKGTLAVALGEQAAAQTWGAVALGAQSVADRGNAVSLGSDKLKRQIINMSAGTADTDAVNLSQLRGAVDSLGGGARINADGTITGPTYNVNGKTVTNVGDAISNIAARVGGGISYVPGSVEAGTPRVELDPGTGNSRYFADTNGDGIGERDAPLPKGTRISNVANGVQDTDAVNVGQLRDISNATVDSRAPASASLVGAPVRPTPRMSAMQTTSISAVVSTAGSGVDSASRSRVKAMAQNNAYLKANGRGDATGSTAPTDEAIASGIGGIAIGSDSGTSAANGVALGTLARTIAKDAVALGAGSVADEDNTVSVGSARRNSYQAFANDGVSRTRLSSATNTRRIVNMAAGRGNTDAVNVGQLRQSTQALGGGAGLNPDGSFNAPTYNVAGNSYSTVGDALGGLDARMNQTNARLAQLDSQINGAAPGLAQQKADGRDMTVALNTDGTQVTFANTASDRSPARVSGATDSSGGTPTYAVGGITVNSTGDAIANIDTRVSSNNAAIKELASAGGVKYLSVKSAAEAASAAGAEAVAVGPRASAAGAASVAIGNGAQASADNSVALGASSVASRANSVSVGSAGQERTITNVAAGMDDTDAVNVSQLKQSQEGSVRYDRQAGGQASDYTSLSLGGPGGRTTTTVRNVRAGVANTDAVNVDQLQSGMGQTLDKARAYTDGRIRQIKQDTWVARREARSGVAAAIAMASLPQAYQPGRSVLAAAVGSFQGEAALAVGLSGVAESGRYLYKAQASANTDGSFGVGMGAGIQW